MLLFMKIFFLCESLQITHLLRIQIPILFPLISPALKFLIFLQSCLSLLSAQLHLLLRCLFLVPCRPLSLPHHPRSPAASRPCRTSPSSACGSDPAYPPVCLGISSPLTSPWCYLLSLSLSFAPVPCLLLLTGLSFPFSTHRLPLPCSCPYIPLLGAAPPPQNPPHGYPLP